MFSFQLTVAATLLLLCELFAPSFILLQALMTVVDRLVSFSSGNLWVVLSFYLLIFFTSILINLFSLLLSGKTPLDFLLQREYRRSSRLLLIQKELLHFLLTPLGIGLIYYLLFREDLIDKILSLSTQQITTSPLRLGVASLISLSALVFTYHLLPRQQALDVVIHSLKKNGSESFYYLPHFGLALNVQIYDNSLPHLIIQGERRGARISGELIFLESKMLRLSQVPFDITDLFQKSAWGDPFFDRRFNSLDDDLVRWLFEMTESKRRLFHKRKLVAAIHTTLRSYDGAIHLLEQAGNFYFLQIDRGYQQQLNLTLLLSAEQKKAVHFLIDSSLAIDQLEPLLSDNISLEKSQSKEHLLESFISFWRDSSLEKKKKEKFLSTLQRFYFLKIRRHWKDAAAVSQIETSLERMFFLLSQRFEKEPLDFLNQMLTQLKLKDRDFFFIDEVDSE